MTPLQTGNAAVAAVDNNIPKTQADNAVYAAANPNIFGQSSTTPTVITPPQGFNNNPIAVSTVTTPDTSGAIVGGAKSTVDQNAATLTPAPTALDNQQAGLLGDIATLTGQDSGKAQAYLDAEKTSGVTQDNLDLTALNNKLRTMTASYDQMQANLGGNGNVETSAVLAAQNAGLTKARSAEIGMVTAQIQAKQGDLTLATKTAHDAIDAKYSTIEDNIKTKLSQLDAIAPQLSAQQRTQALAQQKVLDDEKQKVQDAKDKEKAIQAIALEAAKNGASAGLVAQITNATDINAATQLATPALAVSKTQVVEVNGRSLLINSETGKTVQDLGVSNAIIQSNIAHAGVGTGTGTGNIVSASTDAGVRAIIAANPGQYGHAADAIDAKYGAGTATQYDSQLKAVYNSGQNVNSVFANSNVPAIIAPYANTSQNGIKYIDASTLQGTPTQKTTIINAAQTAGYKVITNKNMAADLVNIQDANSKLDSIGQIMTGIDQPNALSRDLYGFGLTKLATIAQTNPQQAAAGALQSVGLDILKAISGIQGFRGNASVVQQVTSHLPSIYDTNAVAQQKIAYIRTLISDRENAIVGGGTSKSSPQTVVPTSQIPAGYYQASDGKFYKK
jgi:hypothetical protein